MKCPKCGDELSPATKVCPRCGCVTDNRMNDRLAELDDCIARLHALPTVSFGTYFSAYAWLLYSIVLVVVLVVLLMTHAGLFLLLGIAVLAMLVGSLVRKAVGARRGRRDEESFRRGRVEAENAMRILRNDYGEAKEVRDRLKGSAEELKELVWNHDVNRRRAVRVWIAVLVATVIIGIAGIALLGSRDLPQEPATEETDFMNEDF